MKTTEPAQGAFVGVVSTRPAFLGDLDRKTVGARKVPLGIVGIVPVKACDEGGPIRPGDLLTSSSRPGVAMRAAAPLPGTMLGKSLGRLDAGTGTVNALLMLR